MKILTKIYLLSLLLTTQMIHPSTTIPHSIIEKIGQSQLNNPNAIAIDGTTAYVCNQQGNSVSIVDLITNEVLGIVDATVQAFQRPCAIAISGTKAYVCNGNNGPTVGFISIIDLTTATVTGIVTPNNSYPFNNPCAIAISGTTAYVCNGNTGAPATANTGTVSIINLSGTPAVTGIVDATVHAFNNPCAIAISGTTAYVCNGNTTTGTGSTQVTIPGVISIIDLSATPVAAVTGIVTTNSSYPFNNPVALAISGTTAYICNWTSNNLNVVNLTNHTVTTDIIADGFYNPAAITFSLDGATAYVCSGVNGQIHGFVSIIDTATNVITGLIDDHLFPFTNPCAIAISVDGTKAYVCNGNNGLTTGFISIVNLTGTPTVTGQVAAGSYPFNDPRAIAISGTTAYVCNKNDNTVSIIDLTGTPTVTGIVDATVQAFNTPCAIAISGSYAYVCNGNNTVNIVNLSGTPTVTGQVAALLYPFNTPCAIAISGTHAYVCNRNSNFVSIVNIATPASATVTGTIDATNFPFNFPVAVVMSADGSTGYVVNDTAAGFVSIFDPITESVVATVTNSSLQNSCSIALNPSTNYAYIGNAGGPNYVSVMYTQSSVSGSVNAPASVQLTTQVQRNGTYVNYSNSVNWTIPVAGDQVAAYKIYRDAQLTDLIATVNVSSPYLFVDNNRTAQTLYNYYVTAVDNQGGQSLPTHASITTLS